ncbi:hypothetical protein PHYBLDRAFT_116656 [Phycomyces blakesleeanus NRRL 1555(-)]|uniref:RRM domain-containing protein n=1 Tax=Phycomyces blakesleeanus (strain ATCC 8743b / DSM 1359 / FGSC 10004 / NBRC 33097 / NRRL 1555) TaxID=763407 RepID=A0A162NGK4_PHYB8|nr:hypothetical protein PHYBLDRAFT_116656 [Phycomyces blakesleeanus NRRL 1555(-)]OAD69414.1 hypothetical protein PHYBLDRAFT_116656 [Phycomyces blakesleeanus NRRL 1555(-)]|eukprot:XP_018287454.1 hypothetical protein PHYBLDRAFT_116656 [Phycomyces blakesleeanus NRRL 1555(-)]
MLGIQNRYAVVKLFEPFGKITFLDYMFHWSGPKKGQPRGYCFLEYEKKEEALKAMSALHGRIVKGRPLVVSFAHMVRTGFKREYDYDYSLFIYFDLDKSRG